MCTGLGWLICFSYGHDGCLVASLVVCVIACVMLCSAAIFPLIFLGLPCVSLLVSFISQSAFVWGILSLLLTPCYVNCYLHWYLLCYLFTVLSMIIISDYLCMRVFLCTVSICRNGMIMCTLPYLLLIGNCVICHSLVIFHLWYVSEDTILLFIYLMV